MEKYFVRIQEIDSVGKLQVRQVPQGDLKGASALAIETYKTNKRLVMVEVFESGTKFPLESFDGRIVTELTHTALPPWAEKPKLPDLAK